MLTMIWRIGGDKVSESTKPSRDEMLRRRKRSRRNDSRQKRWNASGRRPQNEKPLPDKGKLAKVLRVIFKSQVRS